MLQNIFSIFSRWAASNYENISRVHVGPERLWRPDIMVYNSVEHFDYETTDLLLTSDGTVRTINSNSLALDKI